LKQLLSRLMHRYATPLTTGLFLVSAISGVALFFRWAPALWHSMHEWLSMVLLAPFVFHIVKNWKSLIGYLRRKQLLWPLVLCIVVSIPFAWQNMGRTGENPSFRMARMLTTTPLASLAPVLKTTPEALVDRVKQHGYETATAESTLDALTAGSGTPATRVLFQVMPQSGPPPGAAGPQEGQRRREGQGQGQGPRAGQGEQRPQ
jgi:hypothetical protein